ncbi:MULTISPECIES: hypothetical protein [unclassified Rhizobium]|uniref:hypothetical protein n=1 Tax=unclassified Rhizobium TaxID=2613769 RepID=UPI001ADB9DA0|nr:MULTISPECIES: hypothetical protein [unclassified Rhizobium]MBO9122508.1 hypothetical protein [Rhizobium sp. 16-488-2b]MBO9173039.1 hypothetical protein [Rhizobium sp. 16-488-2a]
MQSLPEVAASIALVTGDDVNELHNILRGYRDKGAFDHVGFKGRKALYDDVGMAKARVLLALQAHGFEGMNLNRIMRLLENCDADPVPGVVSRIGFGRVVDGIRNGEEWSFVFSTDARKMFWGSCRLIVRDDDGLDDLKKLQGRHVETKIDLSGLISPLLR